MTELNAMQQAAVAYIRQGFAVTPSLSIGMMGGLAQLEQFRHSTALVDRLMFRLAQKISKASFPPYSRKAIRDEAEAVAVFGRYACANIQLACGADSGVAVLDVDFYRPAHGLLAGLSLPPTRQVATGRGEHWYFSYAPCPAFTRRQWRNNFILGDACRVTVPPSVHFNGSVYAWKNDFPIAPLPEDFAQAPRAFVSHIGLYRLYRRAKNRLYIHAGLPLMRRYIACRFADQAAVASVPK